MKRRIVYVLALIGLLLAAAAVRTAVSGAGELAAARAALEQGNRVLAQKHFLTAARWYLPFVSTSREAVSGLLSLGQEHLAAGAWPEAVAAFDDARGALWATVWLFAPDEELLVPADEGYARSLAAWKKQLDPGVDQEQARVRYLAAARDAPAADPWWSLLMGLSFVGYVAALAVLAWKWDDAGFRRVGWMAGAAVSFGLWILAMVMT